jgi:hypothetical protein
MRGILGRVGRLSDATPRNEKRPAGAERLKGEGCHALTGSSNGPKSTQRSGGEARVTGLGRLGVGECRGDLREGPQGLAQVGAGTDKAALAVGSPRVGDGANLRAQRVEGRGRRLGSLIDAGGH